MAYIVTHVLHFGIHNTLLQAQALVIAVEVQQTALQWIVKICTGIWWHCTLIKSRRNSMYKIEQQLWDAYTRLSSQWHQLCRTFREHISVSYTKFWFLINYVMTKDNINQFSKFIVNQLYFCSSSVSSKQLFHSISLH